MDQGLLYDRPFANLVSAGFEDTFSADATRAAEIMEKIRHRAAT
ncbi:MAG: hypothetical protein ACR2QJ_04845 [Geminicoccaceae bacterium]